MKDKARELLYALYLMPALLAGIAVCVRYDPPWWVGVPGVFVAAGAWHYLVVRRLPPFRDGGL